MLLSFYKLRLRVNEGLARIRNRAIAEKGAAAAPGTLLSFPTCSTPTHNGTGAPSTYSAMTAD